MGELHLGAVPSKEVRLREDAAKGLVFGQRWIG